MKKIWTSKEFFKYSKTGLLGLGHRNNPSIITIDRLLEKYETIPKNKDVEKHFILAILSACNDYLEYVRIHKHKGSKRHTSVEMLRQQALARLDEILLADDNQNSLLAQKKLLARERWSMLATIFSGKGRIMNEDYWREVVNPHFAGGEFTKDAFEEWQSSKSDKKFAEWLDGEYLPCLLTFASCYTKDRQIASIIHTTKVEYLNEIERGSKEITIQNGIFLNHLNQKFDTNNMITAFSGNGWGIFVMDRNNKIYVGPHKPAEFHHSSFLSGGRVLAAGEIAINNGQLISISNKSGHYKPNERDFYTILYFIHKQGVNLKNIPAVVNFDKPVKYFDAYEVMLNGGKATGLTEKASPSTHKPAPPVQVPQGSKGYLQPIIKHRQAPPPPINVPQGSKGYLQPIIKHRQAPPPPINVSQQRSKGYLQPIIKHRQAPPPPINVPQQRSEGIVNPQPDHIQRPPNFPSEDEIFWDLFYRF